MTNVRWSLKFSHCIRCGKNDTPHSGRGLCRRCYMSIHGQQFKTKYNRGLGLMADPEAMRAYLMEHYETKGESLQDIANDLKCTRQYIYKLMRRFGIQRRSYDQARTLAVERGKIEYVGISWDGIPRRIKHSPLEINRRFFYEWSDDLAYVLGMIYTDGSLIKQVYSRTQKKYIGRYNISIGQKDPYILERIRERISLNRKVYKGKNNKNSYLHQLSFRDKEIFERLESFGLTQNKSLTITFPDIPIQYLNGFFRGLFDGDGCYSGDQATLTTGSQKFAQGLASELAKVGFKSTIRITWPSAKRKNASFNVRVSTRGTDFDRFYLFLYKGATLFLPKKRETFEQALAKRNIDLPQLHPEEKKFPE